MQGSRELLVSREELALAQQMQQVRTYGTGNGAHLLTEIARCADCGSPLYALKEGTTGI